MAVRFAAIRCLPAITLNALQHPPRPSGCNLFLSLQMANPLALASESSEWRDRHMLNMTVDERSLSAFIVEVLSSTGMRIEDAAIVADVLTWANLRGVDSHGVARLPGYISEIAAGQFNPVGRPVFRSRLPSTFVLECAGAAG